MQDRFVGDIGDFGKYRLLRVLTGIRPKAPRFSLGVVWYLPSPATVTETSPNYGQRLEYLNNPHEYKRDDPHLINVLSRVVDDGRSLEAIEDSGVLGRGSEVAFHRDFLPQGWPARRKWLERALTKTEGKDVVFLDPDTGLAPRSAQDTDSQRHVYESEVKPFFERGQTVVVYQHHARDLAGVKRQRQTWDKVFRALRVERPATVEFDDCDFVILPFATHIDAVNKRLRTLCQKSPNFTFAQLPEG